MFKWLFVLLSLNLQAYTLFLEVADTTEKRAQGLMGRSSLEEGFALLMVYDPPQTPTIWMWQMQFPISCLFIDESGVIQKISPLKAYPDINDPAFFRTRAVTIDRPIKYVLETKLELPRELRISTGDRVEFDLTSKRAKIIIPESYVD